MSGAAALAAFGLGLGAATTKALFHAHALYSLGLMAAGAARATVGPRQQPAAIREDRLPRIAVLVIAHDEAAVIAGAVRSLRAQRYPVERFEVVVVADNCSDETARLAEREGARVIERATGGACGKAHAVAFGAEWAFASGRFDAIAVFDADNLAERDFLRRIAERLLRGDEVVQGWVDAKNPADSWISSASALGFWAIAAIQQLPRERLGLSAPLMGTGWAASLEVCRRELVSAKAVTDDLELSAELALQGVRVAFEPEARVFDEKPTRLFQALRQRERWMRGRFDVAERYLPRLLARALSSSGPHSLDTAARLRALDVGAQLISPSLTFSAVALGGFAAAELALTPLLPRAYRSASRLVPPGASLLFAAAYYALPAALLGGSTQRAGVWVAYALQPLYLVLSAPLAVSGWLRRRRSSWRRTEHG
jgi:cellulose synthase/poly-beta-1,6-N-acetylglucosamine synthase-like glycosyltransferase